jgi:hypothetical protein
VRRDCLLLITPETREVVHGKDIAIVHSWKLQLLFLTDVGAVLCYWNREGEADAVNRYWTVVHGEEDVDASWLMWGCQRGEEERGDAWWLNRRWGWVWKWWPTAACCGGGETMADSLSKG